jgi:MFS family permease
MTVCMLPMFLTGAIGVQLRRSLHFGVAGLGLAIGAAFLVAAVTSYGFGHLAGRLGASRQMQIAVVIASLSSLGISLEAHSLGELIGWLVLGGMANAACQPATNLYLAGTVDEQHQGLAFGIKQSAIPLSMLIGGVAVPTVALTIGWRWAYGCVAIVGIFVAWSVALVHTRSTSSAVPPAVDIPQGGAIQEIQNIGVQSKQGMSYGSVAGDNAEEDQNMAARRWWRTRKHELPLYLVILTVAMTLGSTSANAFGAYLVSSSVHHGLSPGLSGILFGIGAATGAASRIVSGIMADRRHGHHLYTVALMFVGGAIGYVLLATGASWLIIPAAVIVFVLGWGWPGVFTFAIVNTHRSTIGQTTGMTQIGAYLGGVIGPVYFGLVVSHSSYMSAWVVNAAIAILGVVTMLIGRDMLRHHFRQTVR